MPEMKISPLPLADVVCVTAAPLSHVRFICSKPAGVMAFNRKPAGTGQWLTSLTVKNARDLFPVGRLAEDTEGLFTAGPMMGELCL